jgi:Zn ribbon nucleic-acid-binding protein
MKNCPICSIEDDLGAWEDMIEQKICYDCLLRIYRHADAVKALIYQPMDWENSKDL